MITYNIYFNRNEKSIRSNNCFNMKNSFEPIDNCVTDICLIHWAWRCHPFHSFVILSQRFSHLLPFNLLNNTKSVYERSWNVREKKKKQMCTNVFYFHIYIIYISSWHKVKESENQCFYHIHTARTSESCHSRLKSSFI